jgi:MFS family permease
MLITCLNIILRLLINGIKAATFTVANLYYNHPILNILAEDFDVSYEKVSTIPTVMQAGYAAGLLFLNPLGDVFRRRAFVLILVWFTATVVSLEASSLLMAYLINISGLAYVLRNHFPSLSLYHLLLPSQL